jgi:hypothetical protein
MNKPSITDVLTKIDALHATVTLRFDNVDRRLDEHSVALLELSTVAAEHSVLLREHSDLLGEHSVLLREHSVLLGEHSVLLREHSGALLGLSGSVERIERRQRVEIRSVDDHERRITVLEQRPFPSTSAQ